MLLSSSTFRCPWLSHADWCLQSDGSVFFFLFFSFFFFFFFRLRHKSYFDDCDPKYGLQRYTITLELRSGNEVLLGEQFTEVDVAGPMERDVGGPHPKCGFAKFVLKTAAPVRFVTLYLLLLLFLLLLLSVVGRLRHYILVHHPSHAVDAALLHACEGGGGGVSDTIGVFKFRCRFLQKIVIAHLPTLEWSSGGISSTVAASLIDLTVLDEHGKVFIGASLPAPLQPIAETYSAQHGFEHSGGDFYKLVVAEEGFELNLCAVEDPADHRVSVLSIVLLIPYEHINRWFGTTHK